jgi:hypothetical protein
VSITTKVVSSNPVHGEVYSIQLYMTCDRTVVFSRYSTNETDCHDITEILLKVALNTIQKPINLRLAIVVMDIVTGFRTKTYVQLLLSLT